MSTENTIDKLIRLRKLTKIVSEQLRNKLTQHLNTLKPLFNLANSFGEYIRGQSNTKVATADRDFNALKDRYRALIRTKPFLELTELGNHLDIFSTSVEIGDFSYQHIAKRNGQEKTITITSPMKWILSYKYLGIDALSNLVGGQKIPGGVDLKEGILHYLALNAIVQKPEFKSLLEDLQFPINSTEIPQFGKLPITYLSCPISTTLPSDDILIDTTEISGTAAFEEVVDIDNIIHLQDSFKIFVLEIVRNHDPSLIADT